MLEQQGQAGPTFKTPLSILQGTRPDVEQLGHGLILDSPHCFPRRLQPMVQRAPVGPRPHHGLLVSAPPRAAILWAVRCCDSFHVTKANSLPPVLQRCGSFLGIQLGVSWAVSHSAPCLPATLPCSLSPPTMGQRCGCAHGLPTFLISFPIGKHLIYLELTMAVT